MKIDSVQAKAITTVVLGLGGLVYLANGVNTYFYTRAEGSQAERRQEEYYKALREDLKEMRQDIKKLLEKRN